MTTLQLLVLYILLLNNFYLILACSWCRYYEILQRFFYFHILFLKSYFGLNMMLFLGIVLVLYISLSSFLCIGTTLAFFHSHGYILFSMQWLRMSLNGLQMDLLHIFIMRILILSWPCTLTIRFAIILSMSSTAILTEDNLSFVLWDKSGESWLLLLVKEHWFAKNELNSSAFFLKSVIYSLFSNSAGIHGTFCQ